MKYIGNAFSLQMTEPGDIIVTKAVKPGKIPTDVVSCIGHQDTATVVSSILGRKIEMNLASIKLAEDDILYVAQLTGGRLPEGATTIPEGMSITFIAVKVVRNLSDCGCGNPACVLGAMSI